MASPPSDTAWLSAWAAVAGAVIALIATAASLVAAVFGVRASYGIADAQGQNEARSEISGYVVKMSELDRTGGNAYRNEIGTLAKQVDSLVARYGQKKLNLSASTYRLTGLFVTLSTTDLELAVRMAHRALDLAARMEPDGVGGQRMSDPLEALQAHRLLADVAAQNLDFGTMTEEYEAALRISDTEGARNRYIRLEAPRFTRAYWALSTVMLVDDLQHPTAEECLEVRRRVDAARKDFEVLGQNPEIVRRAKRIEDNACAVPIELRSLRGY
ncbi:hypothetical protein [Streptomyces phaeofaciens]|uniref:hypothetical protein n=1 Tax=Streptomyces phaeofaciens TaxID=68254 RepID=UPI0036CFD1D7